MAKQTAKVAKQNLRAALQARYGVCQSEVAFSWMTKELDSHPTLKRIKERLQHHRGHANCHLRKRAVHVDFYLPKANIIIEYDEAQHFTVPRALSFEDYGDYAERLHFDVAAWQRLSRERNCKDNDPPHRDEHRALFDAVRDIRAVDNGVRLLRLDHFAHREQDWQAADWLFDLIEA
ncbi:hypothetical protein [Aquibaculum arenosum]|uniref:DUF559 domain-containing protein n=1 Tax=Aquibaculum arenosum TaxID=3032591 RepID=A0ABT5YJH8_9PROT|nr:hypothetical protein [Fodinicurvata sp. CAU 1616]MDF2094945.1 hypothetical protein [Fodinicurvata sp. CAU 1616]